MTILDTAIYCHNCGAELAYDLAVLIEQTLVSKQQGEAHTCIMCDECLEVLA